MSSMTVSHLTSMVRHLCTCIRAIESELDEKANQKKKKRKTELTYKPIVKVCGIRAQVVTLIRTA